MKVFLEPTGLHSRAMVRVARALAAHAPPEVEVVFDPSNADLIISHVIGPGYEPDKPEVVIQYCMKSAGHPPEHWLRRWKRARLVWSYFDLTEYGNGFPFYHAPLGVDPIFTEEFDDAVPRDVPVMTSGFVSHPAAESIEEVALAASANGLRVLHLGPPCVEGMSTTPLGWSSVLGISDDALATFYRRTEWVSGLRGVEGFELPAIEGLCCGARPIVFDRPDMTQWYEGHAVFVPVCHGDELVEVLTELLKYRPAPVLKAERAAVAQKFNWAVIARGFWDRLKGECCA